MTAYTPPEPPAATLSDHDGQTLALFTEAQLRDEVAKARREAIEEAAQFLDNMAAPQGYSRKEASSFDVVTMHCAEQLIRELLK